jgi:histidine ammonia-lyase
MIKELRRLEPVRSLDHEAGKDHGDGHRAKKCARRALYGCPGGTTTLSGTRHITFHLPQPGGGARFVEPGVRVVERGREQDTVPRRPPARLIPVIVIDGSSLTCAGVAAAARREDEVAVSPQASAAAHAAWVTARDLAARQPVYGRNTGVGANHAVDIGGPDRAGHGLRLLRSHAAGAGPLAAPEAARALLVVRLNQLGRGGSGVDPAVLPVLADAINRGFVPPVPLYGAIGTGDLTALASAGLCLLGERRWLGGSGVSPRFPLHPDEALAFISSNAATLGDAAISCHDLAVLLQAAIVIAAMSLLATHGSLEPYAAPVHAGRPHPGQQRVAASVRELLTGADVTPARVQDPYGYRALPQVHGPALDYRDDTERVITTDLNAAAENPLIDPAGHTAWHNGNFHAAYAGLALDALRAALFQTAALSAARLGTLAEPRFTGLNAFLAENPASSGVMILEYVAQAAVADIRRFATPAALGSAVLSRGAEEHAGFSTQSARATSDAVTAYRVTLACELVAAVRALRLARRPPAAGVPLRQPYELAISMLNEDFSDRPLDDDLTVAAGLLDGLALMLPAAGTAG